MQVDSVVTSRKSVIKYMRKRDADIIASMWHLFLFGKKALREIAVAVGMSAQVSVDQVQTVLMREKRQATEKGFLAELSIHRDLDWIIREAEIKILSIKDEICERSIYKDRRGKDNWKIFVAVDKHKNRRFVRIYPAYSTKINLFVTELIKYLSPVNTVSIAGPRLGRETENCQTTHAACALARTIMRNNIIKYTEYNATKISPFIIPDQQKFLRALKGLNRITINSQICKRG